MSVADQFKMGRLPIKPLPYSLAKDTDKMAQPCEFMIDYLPHEDGTEPTYDMYITHPEDRTRFINLSQIIRTISPIGDADELNITIEGDKDPWKLKDILNFIYSRFVYPNTEIEDYDKIMELIYSDDSSPINVLLRDVNNQIILPITTTENVFDINGVDLQTKLNSITRVGFSSSFIKVEETGRSFEFEYPFINYGNDDYVEVRIGGTIINKARYQIISEYDEDDVKLTNATINFFEDIEKGRTISLLFIYNSAADGSTYHIMSGANIAAGSMPITALNKYSDSFTLPDSTSVATSKALYSLYTQLFNAINNYSPYCLYGTSNGTDTNLNITAPNTFTLRDGVVLNIITNKTTKAAGCTVSINNGTKYEIYNGNSKLNRSLPEGKLIRLYYSNTDKRFYIKSLNDYRLSCNRWKYVTEDAEKIISFKGLEYDINSEIFVFRNGLRLFEGHDYSINVDKENIELFVRTEKEEVIMFETHDIIES